MSLFQALGRFFSFKWLIQAFKVNKAADELFTSSAEGVGMAYDIHQEQLVTEYREFMGALTQVETAIEDKRQRLERIVKNREEAQLALEGALTAYEEAGAANNTAAMEEAERDGTRFQGSASPRKTSASAPTTRVIQSWPGDGRAPGPWPNEGPCARCRWWESAC